MAIKSSQDTFKNETIQRDLAIIKAHFKIIPRAIQKLETCGLSLHASISIFEEVKSELECAPPQYEEILSVKLSSILQRNPDFNILCSVNKYSSVQINPNNLIIYANTPKRDKKGSKTYLSNLCGLPCS